MVSAKLATLGWLDFLSKIAPTILTVVVFSGTIVKLYGDIKSEQLESLVRSETQSIHRILEAKLETIVLEMKIHVDEKNGDGITQSMLDTQMRHRDEKIHEIGVKQDEVRERFIASLRTDHEKLSIIVAAHTQNHGVHSRREERSR